MPGFQLVKRSDDLCDPITLAVGADEAYRPFGLFLALYGLLLPFLFQPLPLLLRKTFQPLPSVSVPLGTVLFSRYPSDSETTACIHGNRDFENNSL